MHQNAETRRVKQYTNLAHDDSDPLVSTSGRFFLLDTMIAADAIQ